MKKSIVFAFILLFIFSCSSGVKYLGNSYPESENVKIFFSKTDIKKPFEVIGKVYLDVEENTKDEKIQKMIIDKAKKNGGDAVIMGDLKIVRSGSVTGGGGASTRVGKKTTVGGGTSKSKNTNDIRMEVEVIKYTSNSE